MSLHDFAPVSRRVPGRSNRQRFERRTRRSRQARLKAVLNAWSPAYPSLPPALGRGRKSAGAGARGVVDLSPFEFWTKSQTWCRRRRGSIGIATTGYSRRITSSGGPLRRWQSGALASNAKPQPADPGGDGTGVCSDANHKAPLARHIADCLGQAYGSDTSKAPLRRGRLAFRVPPVGARETAPHGSQGWATSPDHKPLTAPHSVAEVPSAAHVHRKGLPVQHLRGREACR